MKTQDYIKKLNKALSSLENEQKDQIIKEIQSYIDESEANYDTLLDRFGTPEDLAKSYLEEHPKIETKKSIIKGFLKIMTLLFILLVLTVVYIKYQISDKFDYSQYDERTINQKIDSPWIEIENIKDLNISQSNIIIYPSSNNTLSYSCIHGEDNIQTDPFLITQAFCFIKVPTSINNIDAFQSKIVLVQSKQDLNIKLNQSKLQISQKYSTYNYKVKKEQSSFENLKSKDGKPKISLDLFQSSVDIYEY